MVHEMAGLFFAPEEVAVNLELNEEQSEQFIGGVENRDSSDSVVAAYLRGWIEAEIVLRRAIKQSALNGSSPAQQQLINFQKENRK